MDGGRHEAVRITEGGRGLLSWGIPRKNAKGRGFVTTARAAKGLFSRISI